jgi:hypothetical protein
MKVIKAGHIYELDKIDAKYGEKLRIEFVCREDHLGLAPGVQTQEVLRLITALLEYDMQVVTQLQEMLIDRTNHCDGCEPWVGNERIIKALSESARQARLALLYHEQRVLERLFTKEKFDPATAPVGPDGHYIFERGEAGRHHPQCLSLTGGVCNCDANYAFAKLNEEVEQAAYARYLRETAPVLTDEVSDGYATWLIEGSKERRGGKERRIYTWYAHGPTPESVQTLLDDESERRKKLGTPEKRSSKDRRMGK